MARQEILQSVLMPVASVVLNNTTLGFRDNKRAPLFVLFFFGRFLGGREQRFVSYPQIFDFHAVIGEIHKDMSWMVCFMENPTVKSMI